MSDRLCIKVRCFSQLRYALGKSVLDLELPAGTSLGEVAAKIRAMGGPTLDEIPFRLALNLEFAEEQTLLSDGDEVALIPPVQGG